MNIKVLPSSSSPIKAYSDEANTLVKFERQLPGVLLTQHPEVHDGKLRLCGKGGPRPYKGIRIARTGYSKILK